MYLIILISQNMFFSLLYVLHWLSGIWDLMVLTLPVYINGSKLYWLVGWLVWCLLEVPNLWKSIPLKCSITMVYTCPVSWCTISSLFRENNNVVVFPFHFPHLHVVGQLVVHPPSRIVSHPKDKKLPWPIPAQSPSGKAVGSW